MEKAFHSPAETPGRLKWLTFSRLIFTAVLLGSTIWLQLGREPSPLSIPLLALYGLTGGIFFLSAVYAWLLKHSVHPERHAVLQIVIDTAVVSLIIFITGGMSSIFSFLYLVVVIYASLLVSRRWSLWAAGLCGLQYTALVLMESYGIIRPVIADDMVLAIHTGTPQLIYRILMTTMACATVAVLGSILGEQVRNSRREVAAMEAHVKRVDKLAAVGEMAAGLAHEIKNPLAALSGSIQLLREDLALTPSHEKLMNIVLRETDRLSALLSNFLLFAKPPEKGCAPIDMAKAISETIALFEKDAGRLKKITIQNRIPGDVWVEMDASHFRQVLWNLLANAVEATGDAGHVELFLNDASQSEVRLHVRDDGCGIAPGQMKLIFDPFYTTKPRGTGLGLSIVHSILEVYGYRLDVESEGIGTTVILHLKRIPPPK